MMINDIVVFTCTRNIGFVYVFRKKRGDYFSSRGKILSISNLRFFLFFKTDKLYQRRRVGSGRVGSEKVTHDQLWCG